ncbi:hypothetical protein Tco_0308822 [Tanacetum coccineum]
MMTGTKFDIEKFDEMNDFGKKVKMKALLEQQGLAATLEELPAATIVAYDSVIRKKAEIWKKLETLYMTKSLANRLYLNKKLYTFHMHLGKSQSEHIDEFHKLVGDLVAIDTAISDDEHALLLLTSLPSSYDNFVETLLYGRDTLKLEDVLVTLNYRELHKMTEVKGGGGEGLYVRGRSGQRDMKQDTDSTISDEDHALLLLASLPSSYDNFMETLLYGRDTLKLEDVLVTLNYRELHKMTEAKGGGGEGLYVRGRSGQRDMKQDTDSTWYNHKKSQGFVRNEDHVSGSGADEYDSADVMMAMSVEELFDWIIDSGGSYHMTYKRDYLFDFEEYDGGNILFGDGREFSIRGTGKVQVQMRNGSSFVLDNVRYVPELRRNLISLGADNA